MTESILLSELVIRWKALAPNYSIRRGGGFFLSPTLPTQGVRLSVVGWQQGRQKIIEDK